MTTKKIISRILQLMHLAGPDYQQQGGSLPWIKSVPSLSTPTGVQSDEVLV